MHELSWASIQIGGQISKALINDFIGLLEDANLLTDELGHGLEDPTIDDIITIFKSDNDTLLFQDDKADSGEYKTLERWLEKHSLSYIRVSDSDTEDNEDIPSRTVFWTPSIFDGCPKIIIDDTERRHMIHVGELERILTAIESVRSSIEAPKFLNHGTPQEKAYASYLLDKGMVNPMGYLREYLKNNYTEPELPPFEII